MAVRSLLNVCKKKCLFRPYSHSLRTTVHPPTHHSRFVADTKSKRVSISEQGGIDTSVVAASSKSSPNPNTELVEQNHTVSIYDRILESSTGLPSTKRQSDSAKKKATPSPKETSTDVTESTKVNGDNVFVSGWALSWLRRVRFLKLEKFEFAPARWLTAPTHSTTGVIHKRRHTPRRMGGGWTLFKKRYFVYSRRKQ